jgi:hypothetical protein
MCLWNAISQFRPRIACAASNPVAATVPLIVKVRDGIIPLNSKLLDSCFRSRAQRLHRLVAAADEAEAEAEAADEADAAPDRCSASKTGSAKANGR